MQKSTHPDKKIPLHRGHVMQLAKELAIHRNTLLKRWEQGDPHIIYAIALRQVALAYPCNEQRLQQLKQCLVGNYHLQIGIVKTEENS